MPASEKRDKNLAPIPKRNLAEDVVSRLRDAISRGDLAPGERLQEEKLAEFLEVSRGPIREALSQLEREGLVVKQPNSGATVARLSRGDLDEVYSLRMVLEKFAVELACQNIDPQQIEEMQSVVDTMTECVERGITEVEAAELDVQFHETLVQASKHSRLQAFWSVLRPQIHIFFLTRNVANADFREYILPTHQAILDAIKAGDQSKAVGLIEVHLESAYERVLSSYLEHASQPGDD